jgi:hypothetical protein
VCAPRGVNTASRPRGGREGGRACRSDGHTRPRRDAARNGPEGTAPHILMMGVARTAANPRLHNTADAASVRHPAFRLRRARLTWSGRLTTSGLSWETTRCDCPGRLLLCLAAVRGAIAGHRRQAGCVLSSINAAACVFGTTHAVDGVYHSDPCKARLPFPSQLPCSASACHLNLWARYCREGALKRVRVHACSLLKCRQGLVR